MLFDKQPQQVTVERDSVTTSLFNIKESDILNILKSLGANKAHGHNDISIRMLKLSHKSNLKPLKLLFENCLRTGIFPAQLKKINIVPIHKKGDKQLHTDQLPCSQFAEKYLSVSFLTIYLSTSKKTIFFLRINQVLSRKTRVSNNL